MDAAEEEAEELASETAFMSIAPRPARSGQLRRDPSPLAPGAGTRDPDSLGLLPLFDESPEAPTEFRNNIIELVF